MHDDIRKYLEWKSTHTQKAPLSYRLHLNRLAEFTKKPTDDVGMEDLIGFFHSLKNKYSMAHVAYAMTIIKNFFEYHRKQGRPCIDPYLIRIPKFTPHSHTPLTEEDFNAMDSKLSEYDFRELTKKIAIRLLWDTGMRVSELCDLKLSDIEEKKMAAQIVTKKNRQLRWVFWTRETHRLLMKYIEMRLVVDDKPELLIAQTIQESRLTPRSIQRWVKQLTKQSNINKKISPHSFRHGKAHRMLEIKADCVKDIQVILGHSEQNPRAAFSYLRLSKSESERRAKIYLR
jgi:site-specific recombinase XerD